MRLKKSKIKLEDFNRCPGKKSFMNAIREWSIKGCAVDANNSTWKNDDCTAVFIIHRNSTFTFMLNLVDFIHSVRPDECESVLTRKGNAVFRLWWD
jgi:hypothetical protein